MESSNTGAVRKTGHRICCGETLANAATHNVHNTQHAEMNERISSLLRALPASQDPKFTVLDASSQNLQAQIRIALAKNHVVVIRDGAYSRGHSWEECAANGCILPPWAEIQVNGASFSCTTRARNKVDIPQIKLCACKADHTSINPLPSESSWQAQTTPKSALIFWIVPSRGVPSPFIFGVSGPIHWQWSLN